MMKKNIKNGDVYPPYYQHRSDGLPPFVREGEIEYPFEDTTGAGDENKIRGNWSTKVDYILACLGFVIGLGNIWRFPYYCYINGGGAFLIPYFIILIFIGLPLMFMELSLGQFASLGCISVWKVCPIFKGVGIAMFIVSCFVAVYYNVVTAWAIYYLIASFGATVPWASCDNKWNTESCGVWTKRLINDCDKTNGSLLRNGTCVMKDEIEELVTLVDLQTNTSSFVPVWAINRTLPSEEYFNNQVLQMSDSINNIGTIHWQLALYLLLAWLIVFFCSFKGIKTSGKVVYVAALAPYVILLVLFVRALTLDGARDGLLFFWKPSWAHLLNVKTWGDAAVQVFFSLATCWGGLITLSSYNKFHSNCFRNVWIIGFADALTSIFAGCVTFSTIGFMAHELNKNTADVMTKGPGLAFVVYAEAIARLPVAPLWSVIFFSMIIMISLATQLFIIETVVTAVCDEFPERLRRNHRHVLMFVCLLFYAFGVLLCTQAGIYMLQLLDYFSATWSCLIIGFFECMAIAWVYGVDNLLDNIQWMIHYYPSPYIYWKVIWKLVIPLFILAILVFTWFFYEPIKYGNNVFPDWANMLGWAVSFVSVLAIPITALVKFCIARGSCVQKIQVLMSPDDDWGPALAVHRAEHFPLQIPEARQPLRAAKPNEKESLSEIVENDEEQRLTSPDIPHFDRETAI